MISFLILPRELRDRIYAECFVSTRPINIRNLSMSHKSLVSPRLCLAPNLLSTCRQVHEEGIVKLYGENLYFVDFTSSWRFSRSLQWRECFEIEAEQLDICLVCQRTGLHGLIPNAELSQEEWNPNLSRVRRLQISLRQYTYSQWKYRQPSLFPRIPRGCLHVPYAILQRQLCLDLLIVRVLERSLLSIEDSSLPSSWHTVSQRYNVRDVELWKSEGAEDLARLVEDVLQIATPKANNIFISGLGHTPWIYIKTTETPRYILDILKMGQYFRNEGPRPKIRLPLLGGKSAKISQRVREKVCTIARMSGSKVACLHGEQIAFTNI